MSRRLTLLLPALTLTLLACNGGGNGNGAADEESADAAADAREEQEPVEQGPQNPYPEGRIDVVPGVIDIPKQEPIGLAVDDFGGMYIAFGMSSQVLFFTAADGGSAYAGNGDPGDTGDGGLATEATLSRPTALALTTGGLYVVDEGRHRIRWVDKTTQVIEPFAGNGNPGDLGDGGPATEAELNSPRNLLIHGDYAYIADRNNDSVRRIDMRTGTIALFAGGADLGPSSPDGIQAAGARIKGPLGLACDGQLLYISENGGHKVRTVDLGTRVLGTAAGTGEGAYGGDNGPARNGKLWSPGHLLLHDGKLYIADRNNYRLRVVVLSEQKIYSAAGTGVEGYGVGPSHSTQLGRIGQMALGPEGYIYFADPLLPDLGDKGTVRYYVLP